MKAPKTADELAGLVEAELAQHHAIPAGFRLHVVRDGTSWRVHAPLDPEAPERGELVAHAVELGDELARHYDLAE
ncbi:MAG: hypothetical protein P4M07_04025 [Xanthobacteraceae bacterium]|nr:hypothetical protein [Xanthobacteraceae bacterium]